MKYCESIYNTKRRQTREVKVGAVGIGGHNPIRVQSMTTSNTRDPLATADQAMRLADIGCEIVRVTVQGMKEADACEKIRNILIQKGYTIPLVADIHFFPPAAMRVIDFVDKVRVNPGNYVDRRASFKVIEYDDATYAKEIEKIEEKFSPLVEKCKRLKKALRIGTNHGSLSDRIMNRYGDTPQGMVESALEFARVCRGLDYHDFVFSMKSSNPQVMILAYRLLAAEMYKLDWDYPLHLGVTEAGEGEDGRIKSAMGIGSLLLDGIGDTIRVSLTEDPWHEVDPCQRLVRFAEAYNGTGIAPFKEKFRNIEAIAPRVVQHPKHVAMHRNGTVILSLDDQPRSQEDLFSAIGCDVTSNTPKPSLTSADNLVVDKFSDKAKFQPLKDAGIGILKPLTVEQALHNKNTQRFTVKIGNETAGPDALIIDAGKENDWESISVIKPAMILLRSDTNRLHNCRKFFDWIQAQEIKRPVILNFRYNCSEEDLTIRAGAEYGTLFCDGLGDGIWIEGPYEVSFLRNLSFNILQSARMRIIKTDFISCPSCGRTLFDLQDVTKRIRSRTAHLPGVKIAIMGCIVNGPGEMADADFGYVGSRPGKIDLYVKKECVEKNIDFAEADDRLIELIKSHGLWKESE